MNASEFAQIITPSLGNHMDWRAGSGAGGKRPFHVHRHPSDKGGESLLDTAGRPARFATLEAACLAAHRANLAQVQMADDMEGSFSCPWEESEPDPDAVMEQRREDRELEARFPRNLED